MEHQNRPFTTASAVWLTFLLLAFVVLLSLAIGGALAPANRLGAMDPSLIGVVNTAAFLIVLWYAGRRYGIELRFSVRERSFLLAAFILLTASGLTIVLSEVNNIINELFPSFQFLTSEMYQMIEQSRLFPTILLLTVVAPVTEELLFRGIILEGLQRRTGGIRAVVISSLLFGFTHLNPAQFVYGTILGILFGSVYLAYRSVLPSILLHALINFAPIFLTRIYRMDVPGFTAEGEGFLQQPPLLNLAGLLLCLIGATGFAVLQRRWKADTPEEPEEEEDPRG